MEVDYRLPELPIALRHGHWWLSLAGGTVPTHNRNTPAVREAQNKPIGRSVCGTS